MITKKLTTRSFYFFFNLAMPPRLPKGTLGNSRQVWAWLSMHGHIQPEVVVEDASSTW